jgi:hypothetical protein
MAANAFDVSIRLRRDASGLQAPLKEPSHSSAEPNSNISVSTALGTHAQTFQYFVTYRTAIEEVKRRDPRGRDGWPIIFLERFPAKAGPGLDPGWVPVRVKKTRQTKK